MDITVVIPAFNEEDTIKNSIRAIDRQTFDGEVALLVVDNGSADNTREVAESMGATVVSEPEAGSYVARNTGIEHAEDGYVAFTDADAEPDPDWIANGIAALESGADAVSGPIRVELKPTDGTIAKFDEVLGFSKETLKTANLVTRKEVFDEIGTFDEDLISGGDVEWGNRVENSDFTYRYDESVVVSHEPRQTLRGLLGKNIRTGYGNGQKARIRGGYDSRGELAAAVVLNSYLFPQWVGWVNKHLFFGDTDLGFAQAVLFVPLTVILGIGMYYGFCRGLIEGTDGSRIGDYGWW